MSKIRKINKKEGTRLLIHNAIICLLQNKNGESCRAKMEKVASPKWRKMQSSGLCSLT